MIVTKKYIFIKHINFTLGSEFKNIQTVDATVNRAVSIFSTCTW